MSQIKYWLALNRVRYLGTVRFSRLEAYFGDLEHAWNAGAAELRAAGMEARAVDEIIKARGQVSPDEELEQLHRAGVRTVNWNSPDYPARLKEISSRPPVIYFKGELRPSDERSVAVVGTRNPTTYGREAAARLTADLAQRDITIISGLALGIDGVAHRTALDNGGRTIAVVATGLDIVYPKEHTGLCERIQEQGAVISEVPLGVRPDRRAFPRRNRLISGVSLGTLVVEAGETSGALWTAKHALEQDREVFCVPGSIFSPASKGTNHWIQQGAKLVYGYDDILEELNLRVVTRQIEMALAPELPPQPGDEGESALLGQLNDDPLHIDDIRRRISLPIASVSSLLTMLELKGLVKQVGCMHYVRMREATTIYGD